ncbi:MAG: ribonucleoside triphosphate reductase, partial [Thermoprotei archaeon]
CRLTLDLSQLSGPRGLWNTAEGTGSLGVVTINFPRLGYESKNKDESYFFDTLTERMELALEILQIRKSRILKYQNRLMPFSTMNGWSMRNYYLTIGVIGLNEMCLNMFDSPIMENVDFVEKVLKYMREFAKEKQQEIGQLINVEMIPGEGSSYRLAYIDRKECPNIKTLGTKKAPYYSALLIPPKYDVPIIDQVEISERILPLFSGGTIFRVFLGEKQPETYSLLKFIERLSHTKIPYYDITTTYSVCLKEGKFFTGVHYKCPECGSECEVYSRVVGYYRPVKRWNIGKQQEFKDRKYYKLQ